jgi:hypothetical protein
VALEHGSGDRDELVAAGLRLRPEKLERVLLVDRLTPS